MYDQIYTVWIGTFGAKKLRQLYGAWHINKVWH